MPNFAAYLRMAGPWVVTAIAIASLHGLIFPDGVAAQSRTFEPSQQRPTLNRPGSPSPTPSPTQSPSPSAPAPSPSQAPEPGQPGTPVEYPKPSYLTCCLA